MKQRPLQKVPRSHLCVFLSRRKTHTSIRKRLSGHSAGCRCFLQRESNAEREGSAGKRQRGGPVAGGGGRANRGGRPPGPASKTHYTHARASGMPKVTRAQGGRAAWWRTGRAAPHNKFKGEGTGGEAVSREAETGFFPFSPPGPHGRSGPGRSPAGHTHLSRTDRSQPRAASAAPRSVLSRGQRPRNRQKCGRQRRIAIRHRRNGGTQRGAQRAPAPGGRRTEFRTQGSRREQTRAGPAACAARSRPRSAGAQQTSLGGPQWCASSHATMAPFPSDGLVHLAGRCGGARRSLEAWCRAQSGRGTCRTSRFTARRSAAARSSPSSPCRQSWGTCSSRERAQGGEHGEVVRSFAGDLPGHWGTVPNQGAAAGTSAAADVQHSSNSDAPQPPARQHTARARTPACRWAPA